MTIHFTINAVLICILTLCNLLVYAPSHKMWMNCHHQPYHKEDGEIRIHLPQQQHTHLKFVHISGFFGHKDQVELAVHILHCSVVLEKMEITPRIEIAQCDSLYERTAYKDGHRVATEFVCKADHRNVVDVKSASSSQGPSIDHGWEEV